MNRRGYTQVSAIVAMVLALVGSIVLTQRLSSSAGRNQLVYTTRAESGMTSEEALGVAAGAFRGLFVNMLWLRAQNLKQDGKYWEANDLARTITRLQPRFPRAWAFHAWNLAYNISVATQTLEERWQWVNSGVRLLRSEGIPKNPNDMLLHRELAWILLHKVQGRMDDANNYYKYKFAREWTVVVGPPPERTKENRDRKVYIEECAARLDMFAQGKSTIAELREAYPKAGEIVDRLKTLGFDVATPEGRFKVLEQREMVRVAQRRARMFNSQTVSLPPALDRGVGEMFGDVDLLQNGWPPLIAHLRKRVLIDQYNMEPDRMARYTRKYGPLDWRHPATHALYWGAKGVEAGRDRVTDVNRSDFDFINTDRIAIHSLQELYRTGAVQFDFMLPERFFVQMPQPDFIQSYDDNIGELIEREAEQMRLTKGVEMQNRVYKFYSAGYENFLSDAIVLLYRRGQMKEALAYKDKIASWAGRNQNDFRAEAIRTMSMEDYINEQLLERTGTPNVALQEVYGSLQGAYFFGLLAGDDELFRSQFEYAARFHKAFMEQQFRKTNLDQDKGRNSGVMDKNFTFVAAQVLYATAQLLGPVDGAVIYNRAPEDVRRYAYFLIEDGMPRDEKGAIVQTDINKLYPEPDGFAAFKKSFQAELERLKQEMGQTQVK